MEIRKNIFLILIVAAAQCAAIVSAAFAATQENGQPCPPECVTDSMEIVTWYPSPYNEYEELRLYPIAQSNSQCNQNSEGLMYYNTDKNQVLLCKETGIFAYGWTAIGGGTSGNYSTADRPVCDAYSLGTIVFDTDNNKPYVCTSGGVYKPLDSDYDEDGITDAVDYNDNDANDAIAIEADVASGKTFYARGGSRRTGTLVSSNIGGICMVVRLGDVFHVHNGMSYGNRAWGLGLLGNAFYNTITKFDCGEWHRLEDVCGCPNGYTLTLFRDFDPEGPSNYGHVYYCKKN